MVQRCGVLRLTAEPKVEAGVTGQIGAKYFDRDVAVQAVVTGEVDLGHAPEADDLTQFVAIRQKPGVLMVPVESLDGCAARLQTDCRLCASVQLINGPPARVF